MKNLASEEAVCLRLATRLKTNASRCRKCATCGEDGAMSASEEALARLPLSPTGTDYVSFCTCGSHISMYELEMLAAVFGMLRPTRCTVPNTQSRGKGGGSLL